MAKNSETPQNKNDDEQTKNTVVEVDNMKDPRPGMVSPGLSVTVNGASFETIQMQC